MPPLAYLQSRNQYAPMNADEGKIAVFGWRVKAREVESEQGREAGGKIRNPKAEARKKPEARNPKVLSICGFNKMGF